MEVPARVEVDGGKVLILTWADGSVDSIDAAALRAACECAACREPAGAAATRSALAVPELIEITDVRLVGAYAIGFSFAPDDHHTGIYPFDRLRALGSPAA